MGIFVLETGMMYPSITAAARALGVDPSNAAKVVRGQRKEAGGYSFARIADAEAPTQREIRQHLKKMQQSMTPAQLQRRAAHRERSRQRVQEQNQQKRTRTASAAKQTSARVRRTAEERERIKAAHAALVEANEMIRRAKRGGTGQLAKKDLQSLAEQMGASKQGLFRADAASISQYSADDLEQLLRRIETIKEQEAKRRQSYDIKYAQQYGLANLQEAAKRHDALDALARAYAKLREVKERSSGKFAYKESVYETMNKDVQDLDAEQIQDLADRLDEWLDSDREKDQDALDEIFENWQASIQGADEEDEDEQDGDKRRTIKWS